MFQEAAEEEEIILTDDDTKEEDTLPTGELYPYDPTKADIDIREEPQTVHELVIRKFDKGKIKLDPDFQRGFVWKPEQMSSFIESILLNFPLPPLYINENKLGHYVVVDGRQRLTTLRRFLKNEFTLSNLKALPDLNGKHFDDLEERLQSKIEDKKLLLYIIKPSVPFQVVYDIFYRINTNGQQLTRQEIRNCIYQGKATRLLKELSEQDYFKQAIGWGISPKRMKDREAILRYLAFRHFGFENYNGNMNDFVEKAMVKINNSYNEAAIEALKADFERVMTLSYDFFGKENFRYPTKQTRGRINIAVFESIAYFFSMYETAWLKKHKSKIKQNFKILLKDKKYADATRFATGDKAKVRTRFIKMYEILGKI